ncbi:TPA: TraV family lipoprotein [Vibrio parahaemolyticus]
MKKLILVGVLSVLSGCSASYTCGQFPQSGCQPVSTVYDRTNDGFHDYRRTLYDEEKKSKSGRKEENVAVNVGQAHRTLNYSTPGDPILTKPVTLRILFNSWQDKDKDLNAGGFVYIRLRDSEWVVNK